MVGGFRLDARHDLISALDLPPEVLIEWPDSRLVMRAWERWGADTPKHLKGDFSFVLHDHARQESYLVRDHLGNRALYHAKLPHGAAIASAIPPLLAHPEVDRALDPRYLVQHLTDDLSVDDETPFLHIRRLSWGTVLRIDRDGNWREERYWDIDPTRRVTLSRDQDYVDRARELLDRATRDHIRLNGPIAGTLSAGLDSPGVIGSLARALPAGTPIHTFTFGPTRDEPVHGSSPVDETGTAEETARHWPGVIHRNLHYPVRQPRLWENPGEWFVTTGFPFRNWDIYGWFQDLLTELEGMGSRALFMGSGGNLGLSHDGIRALPTWTRQGRLTRVAREVRAISRSSDPRWPGLPRFIWRDILFHLSPLWARRAMDHWRKRRIWPPEIRHAAVDPGWFERSNIGPDQAARGIDRHHLGPADAHAFKQMWFRAFRARRGDYFEAMRNLHGVEILSPLYDRELIEFCLALPLDQFLRDGRRRWLAKRVFADRVPPSALVDRPGFVQGGDRGAKLNAHRDLFQDVLREVSGSSMAQEILDLPRIARLLDNWPTDDRWEDPTLDPGYGRAIPAALHVGQFIRWAERSNR